MINALLKGIMSLIISLVSLILAPIDAIILQFLPDISNALTGIGKMFALVSDYMGFAISLTGLSNETISLIVLFITFKLTVPMIIYTVKLAIKWYDKLKP